MFGVNATNATYNELLASKIQALQSPTTPGLLSCLTDQIYQMNCRTFRTFRGHLKNEK